MKALEESVRAIEKDGLVWGASKLVPVGFGIKKLQINLVVEDEKISLEELQEEIQGFEEYVQSTDIVRLPVSRLTMTRSRSMLGRHAEALSYRRSVWRRDQSVAVSRNVHWDKAANPARIGGHDFLDSPGLNALN